MDAWLNAFSFSFCFSLPRLSVRPTGSIHARRRRCEISATKTQPDPGSLLDLTPDANGALSQEQMQRLFAWSPKGYGERKRLRDYTYVERDEEHRLDNKGQVKSTEVKTYDVMELYGEQVQRLIEKDDKPLHAKDAAKEEEKIQKVIDKRKNESEDHARSAKKKKRKIAKRPQVRTKSPMPTTSKWSERNFRQPRGVGNRWRASPRLCPHEGVEVSAEVPRAGVDRQERSSAGQNGC